MRVLIVEDDADKSAEIRELIETSCGPGRSSIETVDTINGALSALGGQRFDLIVADLVLPQIHGPPKAQDATPQWCEYIESQPGARLSSWAVMTGFSEIANEARTSFARHGVAVIEYDKNGAWKRVLANKVREQFVNPPMDFLIVCALEKERAGLAHSDLVQLGDMFTAGSLDCRGLTISGHRGVAIVLPRTRLISAAIGTVKAAEIFRPSAIAMSGICGGIEGEVELGDLVVPDLSWNYQAGKIANGKLRPELVQKSVPPVCQAALQQMATSELSLRLRRGLFSSELSNKSILMPPMVSGSQVVADKGVVTEVGSQSRKIGAIDMEVAAVFAAAHDFFNGGGIFFAAKTVVDLADEGKDDRYHEYGCALSARFAAEALSILLSKRS